MAAIRRKKKAKAAAHRGRIQAQGGGIETSVSWSRETPPTESEMMAMVRQLESMLTPAERRARQAGFEQLRQFIRKGKSARSSGFEQILSLPDCPRYSDRSGSAQGLCRRARRQGSLKCIFSGTFLRNPGNTQRPKSSGA